MAKKNGANGAGHEDLLERDMREKVIEEVRKGKPGTLPASAQTVQKQDRRKLSGPKQLEIPGAGHKRIPSLDDACSALLSAKAAEARAKEQRTKAAEEIQRLLRKKKLTSYLYVDGETKHRAVLEQKDRISIKLVEKPGKEKPWKKPPRLGADPRRARKPQPVMPAPGQA